MFERNLFDPINSAKKKMNLSVLDLYDVKTFKTMQWNAWMKDLSKTQKETIEQVKEWTNQLTKAGIFSVICPNAQATDGHWWMDYPSDWFGEKFPDYEKKPHLIVILFIDQNNRIDVDQEIWVSHDNIKGKTKEKIFELAEKYLGEKFYWSGESSKNMKIAIGV